MFGREMHVTGLSAINALWGCLGWCRKMVNEYPSHHSRVYEQFPQFPLRHALVKTGYHANLHLLKADSFIFIIDISE